MSVQATRKSDEPQIPYGYEPRSYQYGLLKAMGDGCTRAVAVWHRRSGKDRTALAATAIAMTQRVGTYYHIFPELKQGRKILWDGKGKDGKPFMDVFPPNWIAKKREDDMIIKLTNGSHWQIIGGDKIDSSVGTNPIGLVYSEFAIMSPRAWELFRPILAENEGWAIFIYTPRGHNHGYYLYRSAVKDPMWYSTMYTVDDTYRDSITEDQGDKRVVSIAAVEQERRDEMPEELIQQEFYCSFESALVGSYYGPSLERAEEDGRITTLPYNPDYPVHTFWDIGVSDMTSIWFVQIRDERIHVIDYLEHNNVGLTYYIDKLKNYPYIYGSHYAPFDIRNREYTTGMSRERFAQQHGLSFTVVENSKLVEDIDATRRIFPLIYFDSIKCQLGIDALRSYRKEWDDKLRCYKDKPVHDWSSHAATAFHKIAMGYYRERNRGIARRSVVRASFDPRKPRVVTDHDRRMR